MGWVEDDDWIKNVPMPADAEWPWPDVQNAQQLKMKLADLGIPVEEFASHPVYLRFRDERPWMRDVFSL